MKKFVIVTLLICVAGTLAIAADLSEPLHPVGSWRYKMTINVETPEGLKTGSTVREATIFLERNITGAQYYGSAK